MLGLEGKNRIEYVSILSLFVIYVNFEAIFLQMFLQLLPDLQRSVKKILLDQDTLDCSLMTYC